MVSAKTFQIRSHSQEVPVDISLRMTIPLAAEGTTKRTGKDSDSGALIPFST